MPAYAGKLPTNSMFKTWTAWIVLLFTNVVSLLLVFSICWARTHGGSQRQTGICDIGQVALKGHSLKNGKPAGKSLLDQKKTCRELQKVR